MEESIEWPKYSNYWIIIFIQVVFTTQSLIVAKCFNLMRLFLPFSRCVDVFTPSAAVAGAAVSKSLPLPLFMNFTGLRIGSGLVRWLQGRPLL